MSLASHFRWGYATQLASIAVLAATNIVLPNVLGIRNYAELAEFYAYMGISVTILHEGATLLSLREISGTPNPAQDGLWVAARAAAEFSIIALALCLVVNLLTATFGSASQLSIPLWGLLALSVAASATFAPLIAWKVASHQNRFVAYVTLLQGSLTLLLPMAFARIGIDVRASVFVSLLVVIVVCAASAPRRAKPPADGEKIRARPVLLRYELISASASSFLNVGVTTVPILLLAQRGALEDAAIFKIGVSLMIGAALLVPLNRRTLLSILARGHLEAASRIASAAVLIAAMASILVMFLAPHIAGRLFRPEYGALSLVIPALALMITLQVVADILAVELIHDGKRTALIVGTVGGFVGLVATCLLDEARFAPAATLTAFIGTAALLVRAPSSIFPWQAVGVAIASALISLAVGGALGTGLGALLLLASAFSSRQLRQSVNYTFTALRGGGH